MTTLLPFRALLFDDPSPDAGDGVVDVSGPARPGGELDPSRLADPATGAATMALWLASGLLARAEEPALYLYRIGRTDADGRKRQRNGVVGVLDHTGARSAGVEVAPHPLTIDAPGFAHLVAPAGVPLVRATTPDGCHHRLWALREHGYLQTIADAVGSALEDGRITGIAQPSGLVMVSERGEAELPPARGVVMWERGD